MTDKPTREARYVRAEETTTCPRCGAQPGDQCRTASGRWRRNPHKARIEASSVHYYHTNIDRAPDGTAWSWTVAECHCDRPWRHE